MPIYEYHCTDCAATFELLRPARAAGQPQPCPHCDADARPAPPSTFQAFTMRDGLARRIPDRGKAWHYDKEVAGPIRTAAVPGEHPELKRKNTRPDQPPTVEELESFEHTVTQRLEVEAEAVGSSQAPIRDLYQERKTNEFVTRVARTSTAARLARRRKPNSELTSRRVETEADA